MGSPDDPQGFSSGGLDDQAATGPQLASWVVHLLTNWMGDSGACIPYRQLFWVASSEARQQSAGQLLKVFPRQ